jgi:tetratricopeptide (TPR) repeat protein
MGLQCRGFVVDSSNIRGNYTVAKKQSRKELLKSEDAFVSAAQATALWAQENKPALSGGALLLLVLAVGAWGSVEYCRGQNERAAELFQATTLIQQASIAQAGEEGSVSGGAAADTMVFANEAEKDKAVLAKLQEVATVGPHTGTGTVARFYAAGLEEKLGRLDAAEGAFVALMKDLRPRDTLYFLAAERAAYLQEQSGRVDAAISTYDELLLGDARFYRDHALYHQARLYQAKGDLEKAENLFSRVEKNFPDSAVKEEVRERLAALKLASKKKIQPAPTKATQEP